MKRLLSAVLSLVLMGSAFADWQQVQGAQGDVQSISFSIVSGGAYHGDNAMNVSVQGIADENGNLEIILSNQYTMNNLPDFSFFYVKSPQVSIAGATVWVSTVLFNSGAQLSSVSGSESQVPFGDSWMGVVVETPADRSGLPSQVNGIQIAFRISGLPANTQVSFSILIDYIYFQYGMDGNLVVLDSMNDELTTDVNFEGNMPLAYDLKQNYPNPFNPFTHIRYSLAKPEKVRLEIYDMSGRLVRVLLEEMETPAGTHEISFDGQGLASGVYFYRLLAGTFIETKKMNLVK